jgi:hypothetical protein
MSSFVAHNCPRRSATVRTGRIEQPSSHRANFEEQFAGPD